jgi:ankyrin repeat protein
MSEYVIPATNSVSAALQQALENEDSPAQVKKILEEDTDNIVLSTENEYGNLPLHSALYYGASYGVIKVLLEKYQEAVEVQNIYGILPLHLALYKNASAEVITMLFSACPDAAEIRNDNGDLPLHYSLHKNASYEIVKMLLDKYPKTVEVQNNVGWLPLHFACKYVESSNIIKMIFHAYPGAAQIRNKSGDFPLHYACDNNKVTYPVRKMLFDEYPESIKIQDKDGKIPLDYAEARGTVTQQMRKILTPKSILGFTNKFQQQLILCDTPKFLGISDNASQKNHPLNDKPRSVEQPEDKPPAVTLNNSSNNVSRELLDLCSRAHEGKDEKSFEKIRAFLDTHEMKQDFLKAAAEFKDKFNLTPVHYLAGAHAPPFLVEKLLQLAPDTAKMPDNEGNLPLHRACYKGAPSPDILNMLIDFYPKSITVKNIRGKLPINLVDSQDLQNILCAATLPPPSKHDKKDKNVICIFNKTGRTVLVNYYQSLPPTYVQGIGANLGVSEFSAGMNRSKAEYTSSTLDKVATQVIEPNKTESFSVQTDCDGIRFDFLCYDDEAKSSKNKRGWAINHLIKKGQIQELLGQPVTLYRE